MNCRQKGLKVGILPVWQPNFEMELQHLIPGPPKRHPLVSVFCHWRDGGFLNPKNFSCGVRA